MEIKEIKIKDLVIDRFNARKGEWIKDEELIDSIKSMGVLEPLLVRHLEKKIGVVCGSRRYNASISAGLKTVPCVVKKMTDMEALATSLQENLQRGNLDSVQVSEALNDLWGMMDGKRSYDDKMKEIKKRFGLAPRTVTKYLSISRLSPTIKQLVADSAVDSDTAAGISTSEQWDEKDKEEARNIK